MSIIRDSFARMLQMRIVTASILLLLVVVMVLLGFWALLFGLVVAYFLSLYEIFDLPQHERQGKGFKLKVALIISFGFLCGAIVLYFNQTLFVFSCILVWIFDASAFAVGSALKGPRLVPRISPNKTLSGVFGGLLGVILVYFLCTKVTHFQQWVAPLLLLSDIPRSFVHNPIAYYAAPFLFAFFAQSGDLLLSQVKRMSDISNFSGLLPGHGGTLDRLDSMMGGWVCALILLASNFLVT